ncbi:hypothetical protein [Teredinibacter sp. KSP-S5-2]|uniref:hypothetical protein n=1 Tax=Teredinibacter sp. KSP-S5-2 TaxID=3034506 RepID=UPI0029341476|nr:hypothetical protein [Teredinibacter sp. KSP-S5-2]WNO10572.1 hypothetical protein P5V12_05235 [Teredinibacter sp. KSP-S5-2]
MKNKLFLVVFLIGFSAFLYVYLIGGESDVHKKDIAESEKSELLDVPDSLEEKLISTSVERDSLYLSISKQDVDQGNK